MGFLSGDDEVKAEVREMRRSQSSGDLRRILGKRRSLVGLRNLEKGVGKYEVVEG